MELRLHRGGRFRRWLASAFGFDPESGDRLYRRLFHGAGAFALVYYLVPNRFFIVLPKVDVLLLVLGVAVALEALRLGLGLELPTIRPYEAHRPASFLFYGVALVLAILLLPEPVAAAVILGTALVDPFVGELRANPRLGRFDPAAPMLLYFALAATALLAVGGWPWPFALALGAGAAVLGVAAERVRFGWLDDDLTMTAVPAVFLYFVGVRALGLPA